MAANPWEDFARYSRDMLEQQSAAARTWLDGQGTLGGGMTGTMPGLDPVANAQAMADLWRSWMGLAGSIAQASPGVSGGLMGSGQIAGETLGKLLDPASLLLSGGSQVGETIRRLTEGPRFADVGATERRVAKLTRLWLAMQSATRSYEAVVADAWTKATQTFAGRMEDLQRSGKVPEKAHDTLRLWIDVANNQLMETHRSPRFLQVQTELLRTGMAFLLAEREMIEGLVEPAGLPTRSELDDVHRTVHDLKQRVRALERAARTAATAAAPPHEPPAKPAVAAKTSRQRKPAAATAAKPAGKPKRRAKGAAP